MYATKAEYANQVLTANPSSGGILKVSDSMKYRERATVYLLADGLVTKELVIKSINSKTEIVVGDNKNFHNGVSDCTQYTTAKNAHLMQPEQDVYQIYQGYPGFLDDTSVGSPDQLTVGDGGVDSTGPVSGSEIVVGSFGISPSGVVTSSAINTDNITTQTLTVVGNTSTGSLNSVGAITGNSATIATSLTAGALSTTGALAAGTITSTGVATVGSLSTTGAAAVGALTANSATVTNSLSAGTLGVTGALTAGSINTGAITSTGIITGTNLSGTNTGNVTISTANGLSLAGQALSMALASNVQAGTIGTGAQTIAGVKTFSVAPIFTQGINVAGSNYVIDANGKSIYATMGDSTGTPGNATVNAVIGKSRIPAGLSSITITNNMVTANSIVHSWIQQSAGDLALTTIARISVAAGSFTIYGLAVALTPVTVCWEVKN